MCNSHIIALHKKIMEVLDLSATLVGLRAAGAATPTPDSSGQAEAVPTEEDPLLLTQIANVERRLLALAEEQDLRASGTLSQVIVPTSVPGELPIHTKHAYPCSDTFKQVPAPPSQWPQAPIMLRPTPLSQMKIRGIRYAGSNEYQQFPGICAGCILPVNTGKENDGKSMVIDFESALFVGTLLMRVANVPSVGSNDDLRTDGSSYFDGKKRKFQVIIKGKFKERLPMSELVTGQVFDRPSGKLPAKFLVHGFIRFVSTLAPQLEADISSDKPRFLTPLVATAHTVIMKERPTQQCMKCTDEKMVNFSIYAGSSDMEQDVEEPPALDATSALTLTSYVDSLSTRSVASARALRKKVFNAITARHEDYPTTDTEKEYTFEFYQHLLILGEDDDLKLDMGRIKVGLSQSLNGQPIKIMSAHKDTSTGELRPLWSFELWHKALYPLAKAVYAGNENVLV